QPRAAAQQGRIVDLNTADRGALIRLAGLGPFLADRIIENRPYRNKLDLISRRVIPDGAYARISHQVGVAVDSETPVLAPIAS
ncbi:MAG: helix-hairpin-helix domain-containing protein, partial [Acidobacteriaceae bacterium]|nr:helix-hairpin-helix domain-containing protein [Acidobacteriaceae bacterium]